MLISNEDDIVDLNTNLGLLVSENPTPESRRSSTESDPSSVSCDSPASTVWVVSMTSLHMPSIGWSVVSVVGVGLMNSQVYFADDDVTGTKELSDVVSLSDCWSFQSTESENLFLKKRKTQLTVELLEAM